MTVLQNARLVGTPLAEQSGTPVAGQTPCQAGGTELAEQAGTECVGKDRANSDTPSGSEGGAQVRTLIDSRDREKIGELLALVESGPALAMDQDPAEQFLAAHGLEPGQAQSITMADLYRMYEDWCRGVDVLEPKVFVRRVKAVGFQRSPFMAPGRPSYAMLMTQEGAKVCLAWLQGHPPEFGYGVKFRERMLKGHK